MDPSISESTDESQREPDAYRKADIKLQTQCKPKEEFFKNEVTGNIHITGGLWTPLAFDDIARQTQSALEEFLGGEGA